MACHITGGFSSLEGARERTVWRRPGRQRALHWSDPAEVATQSAIIEQLGQLTKCARVSFKRILSVNTTLESNYCCSVFRLKFVDLAKSLKTAGTCVQYPGLQGAGALGDASTPCSPAGSMAASTHGGTYSHVAVAGGAWGEERGAAAATAAAAARRRGATPTGGAVTPPRSAHARSGRGGQHGARAGGWDRPPRDGVPLTAPVDGVSNRRRAAATEAGAQARSPAGHRGASNPGSRCARSPRATRGGGGRQGGRRHPGPVTPVAGQSFSAT